MTRHSDRSLVCDRVFHSCSTGPLTQRLLPPTDYYPGVCSSNSGIKVIWSSHRLAKMRHNIWWLSKHLNQHTVVYKCKNFTVKVHVSWTLMIHMKVRHCNDCMTDPNKVIHCIYTTMEAVDSGLWPCNIWPFWASVLTSITDWQLVAAAFFFTRGADSRLTTAVSLQAANTNSYLHNNGQL